MIKKALAKALKFARNLKKLYIIIRNDNYWQPKIMPIENTLEYLGGVEVALTCQFNAEALTSIWENGHIAITLWNKGTNKGYQLVGLPVKMDILSIHSLLHEPAQSPKGCQTASTNPALALQVKRKLYFTVEQIIEFDNIPELLKNEDWDEIREEIEEASLINF